MQHFIVQIRGLNICGWLPYRENRESLSSYGSTLKRTIGFAYYAALNKNTTDKFIVVNHQDIVVRHAYIQVADVMLNVCSTSLRTVKRDNCKSATTTVQCNSSPDIMYTFSARITLSRFIS